MKAESLVQFRGQIATEDTNPLADAFQGNRPHLLGLGLGSVGQSGLRGEKQYLERMNPLDVGRHGHDGHDPPPEPRR